MTPVAESLLAELEATAGRRQRILATECEEALCDVAPHWRWDPARRTRLADLLAELEEAGQIAWSVSRDTSVRPHLPAFVTLNHRQQGDHEAIGVGYPWRPELEWAHELRLTSSEFEGLVAVQEYRKRRDGQPVIIPHRERSLEIFGDEKRLDRLASSRLVEEGRLNLELLDCFWAPPPLAYREIKKTGHIVVSENSAGYHSLPHILGDDISVIAYGAGASFAQSVASLKDVAPGRDLLYIGDLDVGGVAIPQRAAAAAAAVGMPAPRPYDALWEILVESAGEAGQEAAPVPNEVAAELCQWFGATPLSKEVQRLLETGVRVAQEALTVGTVLIK